MPKPKLMLDTNVATKLSSTASGFDVDRLNAKIRSSYRVVVSPETLLELIGGVIGAKDNEHLKKDQRRFRVMCGRATTTDFMRFPVDFSLRTVLDMKSSRQPMDPALLQFSTKVILSAKSLDELVSGGVKVRNRGSKRFVLDPTLIKAHQSGGRTEYRRWLEIAKTGDKPFPSRQDWACDIALDNGVPLTAEQSNSLGQRLSAAYEYQKTIFSKARINLSYNADKHYGDWIDNQQLFYLCDPNLFLLTDDAQIKKQCFNCDQCERVLLLSEF